MSNAYDEITPELSTWIAAQHLFFVATAPLSQDGRINCSPIERVSDSCGFGVPKYGYVRQRRGLTTWAKSKGPAGLAQYRAEKNSQSIDGLAGLPQGCT